MPKPKKTQKSAASAAEKAVERAREAQQKQAAELERAREEEERRREEEWNGRHLEAAAAGTSGEPRKVILYIPLPLPRHRAENLTFIALALTDNVRVSTDTVREQHV